MIVAKIVRVLNTIEEVRELSPGTYIIQDKWKCLHVLYFDGWNKRDDTPSISVLDFGDEMGTCAEHLDYPVALIWTPKEADQLDDELDPEESK